VPAPLVLITMMSGAFPAARPFTIAALATTPDEG
jgi:hypothetical protein